MINGSAGMGVQFAELVTEMSEKIKELGPNPLQVRKTQSPAAAVLEPAQEGTQR